MEVRLNGIATSPSSLRFGCVITGPEKSWVRFAQVVVEDGDLDRADIEALLRWGTRQLNRYLDAEPAEEVQPELPLIDL